MAPVFTLVFIKNPNTPTVLLGRKVGGLGHGFWNGFGGKVNKGEPIKNCAIREIQEEGNLTITNEDLNHIGVIKITTISSIRFVHIFICSKYQGVHQASKEMNQIEWFPIEKVPFEKMWPDSKFWLHIALDERYFSADVHYANGVIIDRIKVVPHTNLTDALKLAPPYI